MLELNNLPIQPERYETELIDQLLSERQELLTASLMSREERCFLNGLVRLYKPKKILEIGVDRGGGTCILFNAIKDLPETTVTSIDLRDSYEKDGVRHFIGETVSLLPSEKSRWNLITGKDPVDVIEELDGPFDFLVLDTAHIHPIESLNFLTVFPFMTEDAVIVLHDIGLFFNGGKFPNIPFATKLLFETVTARKLEPDMLNGKELNNIGAFQLLPYTKDHIEDVFSMLTFPWGLSVSRYREFDIFFKKHYSEKAHNYYKKALNFNQLMCWGETGYELTSFDSARIEHIRSRFGEILEKKKFIFYGAGSAAMKLIKYFKKNNLRLPDELWDIDPDNKTGFNIPVIKPDFNTLNNDECGMLVTLASAELIRELYSICKDAGFDEFVNISVLSIFCTEGNELNATVLHNTCKTIRLYLYDLAIANQIDMEHFEG